MNQKLIKNKCRECGKEMIEEQRLTVLCCGVEMERSELEEEK